MENLQEQWEKDERFEKKVIIILFCIVLFAAILTVSLFNTLK